MFNPGRFSYLVCLVAVLFMLAAAAPPAEAETPPPSPANKLLKRESNKLKAGRLLPACRLARGFARFDDEDPAYVKAAELLVNYGISIEDPLGSYTLQRITDLENHEEAQRAARGMLPKPGPRKRFPDAWGKPLRVEIVARKGFLYVVRSAGPDKKYFTSDDLIIGVRDDTGFLDKQSKIDPKRTVKKDLKDTARKTGRQSILGSQARPRPRASSAPPPGGLPRAPSKNGEVEVSIDELLKQ